MSFRRLGVILGHELRVARRDPLPLLVLIVFPVLTMAFLKPAFRPALVQAGHAHANGAERVVPGQAAMTAFFVVSLVAFAFFFEHGSFTWDRLRASSAESIEIVLGKTLPRIAMCVAQFVVVFTAGVVLFDLDIRGDAAALLPPVLAMAVCLGMLGVAVTALCHTAQQANAFSIVGMVLFGAIGGALVPYDVLPEWAKTIAPATPTYWVMRAFRSVILDGDGFGAVVAPTAVLLGMAALCAFVAAKRLRFSEQKIGWL